MRECQGKKICGGKVGKVFVIFFQIIEKNIYQAVIVFFSFFFFWVRNKEEFQEWLVKGKENTQAKCRLTQKTIELSNMGIQASRSHAASKKHLEITHEILCFFQKSQEHLKRKRIAKLNQLLKKVRKSAPKRV